MFSGFRSAVITNRGTDIPNIANKVIVMWFRNMFPGTAWRWLFSPIWIVLSPIMGVVVLLAHISLLFNFGSSEDPLGYTIIVKKIKT